MLGGTLALVAGRRTVRPVGTSDNEVDDDVHELVIADRHELIIDRLIRILPRFLIRRSLEEP